MMTFKQSIEYYNDVLDGDWRADAAFLALLQEVCDLQAKVEAIQTRCVELEAYIENVERHTIFAEAEER